MKKIISLKVLILKKSIAIILILIFCECHVLAEEKCSYIKYRIRILDSDKISENEIYMTDDYAKICTNPFKYTVFYLKAKKSFVVDIDSKTIKEHHYSENSAFYNKFIINFGVMGDDDKLLIPEVVFRNTGLKENINGMDCYQVVLPGSFMNSITYLWFSEKKIKLKGELYSKFLSIFTENQQLLTQTKELPGFPVKVLTTLSINTRKYVQERILVEDKEIFVDSDFFKIPDDYKIIFMSN